MIGTKKRRLVLMETRKRRKKKRPLAALLFIGLLLGFVACTVKIPVPVTMEIDRKAETREEKVDAVYTRLHVPLYCQYPSLPDVKRRPPPWRCNIGVRRLPRKK